MYGGPNTRDCLNKNNKLVYKIDKVLCACYCYCVNFKRKIEAVIRPGTCKQINKTTTKY